MVNPSPRPSNERRFLFAHRQSARCRIASLLSQGYAQSSARNLSLVAVIRNEDSLRADSCWQLALARVTFGEDIYTCLETNRNAVPGGGRRQLSATLTRDVM
jgi:hypothetical protein